MTFTYGASVLLVTGRGECSLCCFTEGKVSATGGTATNAAACYWHLWDSEESGGNGKSFSNGRLRAEVIDSAGGAGAVVCGCGIARADSGADSARALVERPGRRGDDGEGGGGDGDD